MNLELLNGDCLVELKKIRRCTIDALITDPPAGISFMGKGWDSDKGGRNHWIAWFEEVMEECYRVLKPGAHGLVWALPRTSHWTATALENAGFEIRDTIVHIQGQGFPKSLDVSKAIDKAAGAETDDAKKWKGFGTALKPSHETWWLIRKPLGEKTVAANVLKHGTGALNIDASRISIEPGDRNSRPNGCKSTPPDTQICYGKGLGYQSYSGDRLDFAKGRFPSNLVLSEEAAKELDEHSGILKRGGSHIKVGGGVQYNAYGVFGARDKTYERGEDAGASRYFYVAKAAKSDKGAENFHPTVKSTKLMEYLIKLITPPGGTILDPFMGSGSTGVAAIRNDFKFIGIEQSPEYFAVAEKRLSGLAV